MEAAGVARVAQQERIGFRCVKAISDEADFAMPPMARFVNAAGRVSKRQVCVSGRMRPWQWTKVAAWPGTAAAATRPCATGWQNDLASGSQAGEVVTLKEQSSRKQNIEIMHTAIQTRIGWKPTCYRRRCRLRFIAARTMFAWRRFRCRRSARENCWYGCIPAASAGPISRRFPPARIPLPAFSAMRLAGQVVAMGEGVKNFASRRPRDGVPSHSVRRVLLLPAKRFLPSARPTRKWERPRVSSPAAAALPSTSG